MVQRVAMVAGVAGFAATATAGFAVLPSYESYFYAGSGPRVNDRLIVNDGAGTPFEANGLLQFDISSLAGPLPSVILTLEKYNAGFFAGSSDADPIQIDLVVSSRDVSAVIADDPNITDPNEYSSWLANDLAPTPAASVIVGDDGLYSFDLTDAVNALLGQGATRLDLAVRGTRVSFDPEFNNPYFATSLDTAGRLAPTLSDVAIPSPASLALLGLGGLAAARRRR